MSAVVVAGLAHGPALHRASWEAVAAARSLAASLGVPLYGALLGSSDPSAVAEFATAGMTGLYAAGPRQRFSTVAECQAAFIASVAKRCDAIVVLAPHTPDTAEWLPFAAAMLDAAAATDVQEIIREGSSIVVRKPICGGAVMAEYALSRRLGLVTLSQGAVEPAAAGNTSPTITLDADWAAPRVEVVEEIPDPTGAGPALKQASTVVAGGLGVGGRDQWRLIIDAAAALGAGVGATRAAVESGWAPSSCQVGYSGTKIAPNLYIAIGISGAVHHLAGITQAKNVVAINSDPAADIFKVARFGVVGDAKLVVPAFVERIQALRG